MEFIAAAGRNLYKHHTTYNKTLSRNISGQMHHANGHTIFSIIDHQWEVVIGRNCFHLRHVREQRKWQSF